MTDENKAGTVVDMFSRKPVAVGEEGVVTGKQDAIAGIEEVIAALKNDGGRRYDKAVLVILDDGPNPGFRTATFGCTHLEGLGILDLARTAVQSRLFVGGK